mmetsp:Transcript_33851/g.56819  ORF Transcript_33851/g.56819 Transcript_33851/m.56819 type:complete len:263 (+) Transcript_33851:279-1067(+)
MWYAVAITIVAATGNNVGKALQKKAVQGLPRLIMDRKVVKQYLKDRTWMLGLLADIGGALLNIVAIAQAPVSVVQPLMSSGLAILAVFAHFYLDEKLQRREWAAVGLTGLGIIGMGISTEDEPENMAIFPMRIAFTMLLCISVLAICSLYVNSRGRQRNKTGDSVSFVELLAGAQVGMCFGLSASSCRTGFLLATLGAVRRPWMAVMGLLMSVGLTTSGLLLQTEALKDGRAVVVCTTAGAAALVTAVFYGACALDERLPQV